MFCNDNCAPSHFHHSDVTQHNLKFWQFAKMAAVAVLKNGILRRVSPNLIRRQLISTSKNTKSDAVNVSEACKADTIQATNKNWVSYGFDIKSKKQDRRLAHILFFMSITVTLVWGGFYMVYFPDYNLKDWSTRQAFLELRRRERLGLPLVDPNLIDPAKIKLPSDEELGDTEIII